MLRPIAEATVIRYTSDGSSAIVEDENGAQYAIKTVNMNGKRTCGSVGTVVKNTKENYLFWNELSGMCC